MIEESGNEPEEPVTARFVDELISDVRDDLARYRMEATRALSYLAMHSDQRNDEGQRDRLEALRTEIDRSLEALSIPAVN